MINIENFHKQHCNISAEIQIILSEVEKDATSLDTSFAALHISILAGQLKMHLISEDKFLYPSLISSSNLEIKKMTEQYMEEMGSLAADYTDYKNKYNTRNKIYENIPLFINASKVMMLSLKNRIEKEDHELYHLIIEQGL